VKKKEKKVLDAQSPLEPTFIEQLLSPPKVVVTQDEIAPKKKQYKGKKKTGKPALPTVKEDEEFYEGDPCVHIIRLYEDIDDKKEVEENHSPSLWRM
jgi:hypothetical protein